MAKQKTKEPAEDSRLTVRVHPDYLAAIQLAAKEAGVNPSILARQAIQEYIEQNENKLSPELREFFRRWRQDRKRSNML
jgi:hypothetical protein